MAVGDPHETAVPERRARDAIGLAIFVVAAISVYGRIFFGVDFTDEAFYIGLPYSFALGHRPLLDEIALHQFAGIVLLPFVKAYLAVVGSNAGLVLFARHLYFAAALACAVLARGTLARAFGKRAANLSAAVVIVYIPFLVPGLSYNTIASFGMLVGAALVASASLPGSGRLALGSLGCGTLALALASFVYPPIFAAAALTLLLALAAFWRVGESGGEPGERALRWRAVAVVSGTGFGAAALGFGVVSHYGGVSELQRLMALHSAWGVQGGGEIKLQKIVSEAAHRWDYFAALFALIAVAVGAIRWVPRAWLASITAAFFAPALFASEFIVHAWRPPQTTSPFVLTAIGLLAPVALVLARKTLSRSALLALSVITLSSFVATFVVLWATANGLRNVALGMIPACIVAIGCASRLCAREAVGAREARSLVAYTILVTSLLGFLVVQNWTHAYRDNSISAMGATIETGAWKGIRTTLERKRFVELFQRDIAHQRGDAETIIFTDYFPAGYLMSDLRPRTPAIWLFPWNDHAQGNRAIREAYAENFDTRASFPDLLVRMKCIPMRSKIPAPQRPSDPLALRLAEGSYSRQVERMCYAVSRRNG
jgi:hypothetical protein